MARQTAGLERFPHDCSGGGTGVSPVRTGETPVPPDYGRYTHARAALERQMILGYDGSGDQNASRPMAGIWHDNARAIGSLSIRPSEDW